MARPQYTVLTFDLATPRSDYGGRIVDVGQGFDAVSILAMPAGATASLAFGTNGQFVPVAAGDSFDTFGEEDGCQVPANEGLYLQNPAGAGNIVILVSFGSLRRAAA